MRRTYCVRCINPRKLFIACPFATEGRRMHSTSVRRIGIIVRSQTPLRGERYKAAAPNIGRADNIENINVI